MWDPKRLDPDGRKPEPVRDQMPGTALPPFKAVRFPALEPGQCGRCHLPYASGETMAMPVLGPEHVRWHLACWNETYPESAI
jgi:hypothetical protein